MGKVHPEFVITKTQQIQDVDEANQLITRWRVFATHVATGQRVQVDVDTLDSMPIAEALSPFAEQFDALID